MKIDIYTHVVPSKYKNILYKYSDKFVPDTEKHGWDKLSTITDPEARLGILDEFEDVAQVLSIALPPLEEVVGPKEAAELARIANDEMAEWVARYPQRYIADCCKPPPEQYGCCGKRSREVHKRTPISRHSNIYLG